MYKNKKIIALIPARGASKGLARKNIKPLLGRPLIAWTIEQAKSARYIDRVIVSTDDEEIAEISKKHNAEVPFMRPNELARDNAKAVDVVLHALDCINNIDTPYDILALLQPTSPLRLSEDIDKAVELLFFKRAQAIVSVCEVEHHPYWTNKLRDDGSMKHFLNPKIKDKNRQELPEFYRLNGAIFLAYCKYIKEERSFLSDKTFAYVMPQARSVDIDSDIDFKIAEVLKRNA